jgi:hypothetical protein
MNPIRKSVVVLAALGLASLAGPGALGGEHTWDVWEVFSNSDGTIQFIELRETNGGAGEFGVNGNTVSVSPSNHTYVIPAPALTTSTAFKSFLLATAGFDAIPGAPTPDRIIPANFIAMATDNTARFEPWDTATWTAGTLPTNGIRSLTRTAANGPLVEADNTPTNFAGDTATIDASGGGTPTLPGEPGLAASRLNADGSSISVSWDTAACTGEADHQILFGNRSGLPALAGGTYTLQGGTCSIGAASPYTWSAPAPSDASGLLWFLVVAENNTGTEGSWGRYNAVSERNGTGTGGSSGVCAITNKDLTNTCGQ